MLSCDLVIVGTGPAGMSAAINAGSEGLNTTIVDKQERFGGQAGTSTLIENFMGFPDGVSGDQITKLAVTQAAKFQVDFRAPFLATKISKTETGWRICDDDDLTIDCKVLLLAIGISYKALNAINVSRFIGQGVSYGSPSLSESYVGKTVAIVGGANSAGQAAIYLSMCEQCKVKLIVRGTKLEDKMSTYLIEKIASRSNIQVFFETEIDRVDGHLVLETISVKQKTKFWSMSCDKLFILIGAKAKTTWLRDTVPLSPEGFIYTGSDANRKDFSWKEMSREPFPHEAAPGIFAAGDVRAGSVKRVVNAAGEGAAAVSDIHRYLALIS